ncbi:MAG: lipoprotein [Duodenibacillus sp.]|nr:lipoprotein [Duodenibacillus sp.]HBC70153.1 hypothetical protein [Sutterella sp.]
MFRAAACAIVCLTMLSACGLKGPLYLPDPSLTRDPEVTMPGSSNSERQAEPAAQEKNASSNR